MMRRSTVLFVFLFLYPQPPYAIPPATQPSRQTAKVQMKPTSRPTTPQAMREETPFPPFHKGYEIYVWRRDAKWCFSILIGTNRAKNPEEITGITSSGQRSPNQHRFRTCQLRDVIHRLKLAPRGTAFRGPKLYPSFSRWSKPIPDMASYVKAVTHVKRFCKRHGIYCD